MMMMINSSHPQTNYSSYYSSSPSCGSGGGGAKIKPKKPKMRNLYQIMKPNKNQDYLQKKLINGNKKKKSSTTKKNQGAGVLGLLIANNLVERGSRVSYLTRKDGTLLKRGRLYEDGIMCDCCDQMFTVTKFEAHAGSTNRRPTANLFLDDDNRSILDCQLQLKSALPKSSQQEYVNDDYCSVCNDGGDILLCDSCTSSFHFTCIGLASVPDSELWFCPACACQICHQVTKLNDLIRCAQCEHHFHITCIKDLGFQVCADDAAKWLCTDNCERIYLGLMERCGNVIPLNRGDNLSWSLLRYDQNDTELSKTKLLKALDVMRECFEPVKHPLLDKDMIEDVIFSRATKRSNLEGFFTAVLEKNDEIVTVVTLRIHGYKVAEIPFVATTSRHRGKGMCRILMNEVERMIRGLGVERIVLPASTDKLSTWTGSFGFSEMTDLERRDLVKCKCLEFLGTQKCLKIL